MRAVVTGGAGFIGSHLVDALLAAGIEVHVIDNLSTGGLARVPLDAHVHVLDVRDERAKALVAALKPDVLFHQAAQVDVQRSVREPDYDASVNVVGTVNMLEAARLSGAKFIFASSCAVYGDRPTPVREDDPTEPISFYGLSKWAGERYVRLFHARYGVPYTVLRYANVYGPRQTPKGEGGVVAIFMDRIREGLPVTVFGDGNQTRDFVYVKDVVAANVAAIDKGHGQTLHVSTGTETSVNELLRTIRGIHPKAVYARREPERPGDIRHSRLANDRALAELGWSPTRDLGSGLLETYRAFIG